MSSYINKKHRAFRKADNVELRRKRSDGRLKRYTSATDARVWCDNTEQKRQYILDLVRQENAKELSLGKYIPIGAIIDILLANKDQSIKRLEEEVAMLRKFVKENGLKAPPPPPPPSEQERIGQGGMYQGEIGQGGMGQAEIGQEEMGQGGIGQGGMGQGGIDQGEMDQGGLGQREVVEDTILVSSAGKPLNQPGSSKIGGAKRSNREGIDTEEADEDEKEQNVTDFEGQQKKGGETSGSSSHFVTDTSDNESGPVKTVSVMLKGKTPEEQLELLKKMLKEKEDYDNDQRAIAQEAIQMLESIKDIAAGGDGKHPSATEASKEGKKSTPADDLSDLKKRLNNLRGLEDEIRKLRDRAPDQDKLKERIAELEKEFDRCRCKLKEIEILRVERDCLKMRCEDLGRVQRDYEDLLKRTQGFDAIKAECALYRNKYEELKHLEEECDEMRGKMQRLDDLEKERQILLKEIEGCECCMNNQEDEIKRLACHIECLSQDLDKRQNEMKVKVCTLRAHLERKDCIIAKSEQQLADVEDQLHKSIEELSCETTCLRSRIEELEDEVIDHLKARNAKDEQYKTLENTYNALQQSCKNFEDKMGCLEENNKALLEKLESEKSMKSKLEEALRSAIKSDEHLKQMLTQAKCAIKCISQKLEGQDFVTVGRLEAERANYLKKIKQLEEGIGQPCGADRIAELEEELKKSDALNKVLQEHLEEMKGIVVGKDNRS